MGIAKINSSTLRTLVFDPGWIGIVIGSGMVVLPDVKEVAEGEQAETLGVKV